MKLVIDPGALSRSPHAARVREHLSRAPENEVIFTDFALQEAFQGANAAGLRRTFGPIREFPAQIVCLKKTGDIARLDPASSGLHARFADELQSNRLRTYLHDIFTGADGVEERVALGSTQAASRFAGLMPAVPLVRRDMMNQLGEIDPQDLRLLRKEGRISERTADAIVRAVSRETGLHFRESGFTSLPAPEDVVYSFQFRFILANYVLGLFWGVAGGLQQAKEKSVRNDVTDTTYAAYATFYDGLVTADQKLANIYRNTQNLLQHLFNVPTLDRSPPQAGAGAEPIRSEETR